MNLSAWALRHRTLTLYAMLAISFGGRGRAWAYMALGRAEDDRRDRLAQRLGRPLAAAASRAFDESPSPPRTRPGCGPARYDRSGDIAR